MEKDNKYYVYIHKDDLGRIFYVGKGKGKRARSTSGRSKRWRRHVNKYGLSVEIFMDGMSEVCAHTLEKIMIRKIGKENLCNLTDGGEGTSGRIPTMEQRIKCSQSNKGRAPSREAIQKAIEKTRKKVGTKCGLVFDSITDAAKFVAINGNVKAAKSSISACCRGRRVGQCYGYEFRYIENGELVDSGFEPKKVGRRVANDIGMEFETIVDAEKWLKSIGHTKAMASNISQSCLIKRRKAYGYKWRYL